MPFPVSDAALIHMSTLIALCVQAIRHIFASRQINMAHPPCYHRPFVVGSAPQGRGDAKKFGGEILKKANNAIKRGEPTADIVKLWPRAEEFGFPNEEAAF